MTQLNQLSTALKTLLFDMADECGRQLKVIRRRRVFTGGSLVQTLVFAWLNQPKATGDQRAQMAARCRAPVTEQAIDRRFTPELAELLRHLIEAGVGLLVTARPRAAALLSRFPAVVLQDSTVVSLPDALKGQWPGCGGRNGQTAAAVQVQVQFDLVSGGLPGLRLEPGKQPDQATALGGEALPAGALQVADLGYFDLDRLEASDRAGRYFLSRIQVGTTVFDAEGERLDLWKWLAKQKGATVDRAVQLGAGARLRCRLVALRCPPEVVRKRRQRLRRDARKKGRPVSAAQWEACTWMVLVTNVPAEWLTAEEALIVYGARWQVELLFKAWKGGNHLAESRGTKPVRVLCEFYAKLLGILIQQWLVLVGGWSDPARSLRKAARWVRQSAYELAGVVSRREWDRLEVYREALCRELQKTARISRRRKQPSTYQLLDQTGLMNCSIP
jgi:hypothetical protein